MTANEFPPQHEGMDKANWLVLNDVIEPDAPSASVAEQALIARQVLAPRDQQNIPNSRQHQDRQRVVNHRLVISDAVLITFAPGLMSRWRMVANSAFASASA